MTSSKLFGWELFCCCFIFYRRRGDKGSTGTSSSAGFADGLKRIAAAIFDCDDIALVTTLQGMTGSIKGVPIKVSTCHPVLRCCGSGWLLAGGILRLVQLDYICFFLLLSKGHISCFSRERNYPMEQLGKGGEWCGGERGDAGSRWRGIWGARL